MEPLDAFYVLTYARQLNDEEMKKACREVIDDNAEVIVADESFLDVKHELLLSFVERSSARIRKETTLFQTVDRWAAKRCEKGSMTVNGENKRSFMGKELLEQFRFSLPRQVSFQMCLYHRNFVFNWSYRCFYAVYIRFHPWRIGNFSLSPSENSWRTSFFV